MPADRSAAKEAAGITSAGEHEKTPWAEKCPRRVSFLPMQELAL